jgi:hypothetical protein
VLTTTSQEIRGTETVTDIPEICRTPSPPVTASEKRIVLIIAILAGFITPFDGSR